MATIGALASVVLLFLNARPVVSDERSEEFRRSVKESLTGPFQANRSDGTKPGIGIERKNKIYVKARLIFLIGIFYSDPQLYLLKISSLLRGCLS